MIMKESNANEFLLFLMCRFDELVFPARNMDLNHITDYEVSKDKDYASNDLSSDDDEEFDIFADLEANESNDCDRHTTIERNSVVEREEDHEEVPSESPKTNEETHDGEATPQTSHGYALRKNGRPIEPR